MRVKKFAGAGVFVAKCVQASHATMLVYHARDNNREMLCVQGEGKHE